MDLPRYYLFGARPVKIVGTENGGMEILAYNWQTTEFETAPDDYLPRALIGHGTDDTRVSEAYFEQYVQELREKKKHVEK